MSVNLTAKLATVILIACSLATIGCESSATSTPVTRPAQSIEPVEPERTKVDVDIGGGRGINVDVDGKRDPLDGRRDADVDVNIGGPNGGVRVDVDE